MDKSAVFSKVEGADYNFEAEFDHYTDFTQFLAEAKKNAHQIITNTSQIGATGEKEQFNCERKHRKSWKKSLFFWLKKGKKPDRPSTDITRKNVAKPRRGPVSGPIVGSTGETTKGRARKPVSGPLTGLFGSTKGDEVPYMCLAQIDDPHKVHSYGPVYLVT